MERAQASRVMRRIGFAVAAMAVFCLLTPWIARPGAGPTVLAVIGDYGSGSRDEADVARLVTGWHPDAVITVGDNNYPRGAKKTIDANVGRYYHAFIGGYSGRYGGGSGGNRFFPALGNHDWMSRGARPYLAYFDLPGNERYYDVALGPVRVFVVDSDPHEPDGNAATSMQALWLRDRLTRSAEPWKIVVFHHPPYSSGMHGPATWMQWPFEAWGATAVIAGHDHDYERILVDGFPYFVDGFGGGELRSFRGPAPGSQVRFDADWGAMRVEASPERIRFEAITRGGKVIDTYEIRREAETHATGRQGGS